MPVSEFKALRNELDTDYRIIVDVAINTGLRMVELWAVRDHREWFKPGRRIIDLPAAGAAKKPKMKETDRTIVLTERGVYAMENFYQNPPKYKSRATMNQSLKRAAVRAGIDPNGINSKSFRKILISWLFETRKELGIDLVDIASSMGHTKDVMMDKYAGMRFSQQEHDDMLEFVKGWGAK
jgi:integrase